MRASNEAIVRRGGDGEKVGIGREGGERIPGFEVPELELNLSLDAHAVPAVPGSFVAPQVELLEP